MAEEFPLVDFGWAPGGYTINCIDCPKDVLFGENTGAKRAWRCEKHAQEAKDKHDAEWRELLPPKQVKTMDFNINYTVLVKLTDIGLAELKRQHDELAALMPKIDPWTPPATDEDGFSKFQLWHLMKKLGHLCGLGRNLPFETTIKIILDQK